MYVTQKTLAASEGCSIDTIIRIRKRMEQSGRYPDAVKKTGVIKICKEDIVVMRGEQSGRQVN